MPQKKGCQQQLLTVPHLSDRDHPSTEQLGPSLESTEGFFCSLAATEFVFTQLLYRIKSRCRLPLSFPLLSLLLHSLYSTLPLLQLYPIHLDRSAQLRLQGRNQPTIPRLVKTSDLRLRTKSPDHTRHTPKSSQLWRPLCLR
jgi:hypothetical protein